MDGSKFTYTEFTDKPFYWSEVTGKKHPAKQQKCRCCDDQCWNTPDIGFHEYSWVHSQTKNNG